ncbi:MAG TPA: amylo-alpha-1,6-glucosidase [Thermoanaerobaculia bacterium]|nr:amylo-alpha-1,6-glucosidase [Thermoanaerobaculia bacterium]
MEEQTTTPEKEVRSPLAYSGADLAARALSVEWLETDGLGGFACGTAAGARTRKYHGWYAPAVAPPGRRLLLVAGCDEFVVAGGERTGISTQLYRDAVYPDGRASLASFRLEPFPTWLHRTGRFSVERSLCLPRGRSLALVRWANRGTRPVELTVRPLLAYRSLHELQREGGFFAVTEVSGDAALIRPPTGLPALRIRAFGARIANEPDWYRRFHYSVEEERGYEADEDLWSPLLWKWELPPGREAWAAFACDEMPGDPDPLWQAERKRRDAFPRTGDPPFDELAQRAESFLVETPDGGGTILSGYPWGPPRGRDAMVAAPGLALAVGRYRPFARVLNAFASRLRDGLLPSESPEDGGEPAYGSIDAPLWFILAVEWFGRARRDPSKPSPLLPGVREIIAAYRRGTHLRIRAGEDLLLSGGEPGRAVTWMDAIVEGEPVTPRHGRPVEVNALWHAALKAAARLERLSGNHERARELEGDAWRVARRFNEVFWDEENGRLYDVVGDAGSDSSLRPNQIYAVAISPDLLPPHRARAVYWSVRRHLLTPFGLRTLDPRDPRYRPRCEGTPAERDRALHQGTAWPALLGPFVDAHFRVLGRTPDSIKTVRAWLAPLRAHIREAGAGSISEAFDGDPPHAPRGSFAHAAGVAELARIVHSHFAG